MAIKRLGLCFFEYDEADLEAFFQHKKKDLPPFATAKKLPMLLPLADLRRHVRRRYLQPEQQLANLWRWHKEMLEDPCTAVSMDGRHLVAGGELGFKAFETVWANQMDLVQRGYVSGKQHCWQQQQFWCGTMQRSACR
jgi:hypothetical protein